MSLEQRLGTESPTIVDPVDWTTIPNAVKKKLRPFFYNEGGNVIASDELITSFNNLSGSIHLLRGRHTLFPWQISQGLRIQAVTENRALATQLRSMAWSVSRR